MRTSTGADIRVAAIVASSAVVAAAIVTPSDESWRLLVGFVRQGRRTLFTSF